MQVVQHEHDRPARGRGAHEPGRGLEQAEARRLGLARGRLGQVGQPLAQLGEDLREVRAAGAELRAQHRGLAVAHVGTQRLHPGPVGRSAARLPASADEHPGTAALRLGGHLLGEPALADPGLPDEQDQPAAAGERVVETGDQRGQLALSADERAARCLARRSPGSVDRPIRRWWPRPGLAVLERGVLLQDRVVEAAQLRARLDPDLLHQHRAGRPVRLERVGLAARAVQGEHPLRMQPLAQRLLAHQRLQLRDDLAVAAGGEVLLDGKLQRGEPELLEPADLGGGERLRIHVVQGRPAPQRERVARSRPCDQRFEASCVDVAPAEPQLVAVRVRDDLRAVAGCREDLAQP